MFDSAPPDFLEQVLRFLPTTHVNNMLGSAKSPRDVQLLVRFKADVTAREKHAPLLRTATHGHLDVVAELLRQKADPDVCGKKNKTVLHHLASVKGLQLQTKAARVIDSFFRGKTKLANRGDATVTTPLVEALANKNEPVATALLDLGLASLPEPNRYHQSMWMKATPLAVAMYYKASGPLLKRLVDAKACVQRRYDREEHDPLALALNRVRPDAVTFLLSRGAKVLQSDSGMWQSYQGNYGRLLVASPHQRKARQMWDLCAPFVAAQLQGDYGLRLKWSEWIAKCILKHPDWVARFLAVLPHTKERDVQVNLVNVDFCWKKSVAHQRQSAAALRLVGRWVVQDYLPGIKLWLGKVASARRDVGNRGIRSLICALAWPKPALLQRTMQPFTVPTDPEVLDALHWFHNTFAVQPSCASVEKQGSFS